MKKEVGREGKMGEREIGMKKKAFDCVMSWARQDRAGAHHGILADRISVFLKLDNSSARCACVQVRACTCRCGKFRSRG